MAKGYIKKKLISAAASVAVGAVFGVPAGIATDLVLDPDSRKMGKRAVKLAVTGTTKDKKEDSESNKKDSKKRR